MHKYEKGDLVQGPKGCVMMYQMESQVHVDTIIVADENMFMGVPWKRESCRPYAPAPDYSALLEAAKGVAEDNTMRHASCILSSNVIADLRKALADLEPKPEPDHSSLSTLAENIKIKWCEGLPMIVGLEQLKEAIKQTEEA